MAFGNAIVVTNEGKAITSGRMKGTTPTQLEPLFLGVGTGAFGAARTAVVGDTALTTQVETRSTGVSSLQTTSVTNDTYQVIGSVVATASRDINEVGLFDAASGTDLMYVSATFANVTIASGEAIQCTIKVQHS